MAGHASQTVRRRLGFSSPGLAAKFVRVRFVAFACAPSANQSHEILGNPPPSMARLEFHQLLEGQQLRRTMNLPAIAQVCPNFGLENWQSNWMAFAEKTRIKVFIRTRSAVIRGLNHEWPLDRKSTRLN